MEPKNPIIIDGVDVSGCEYCLKMTKYRCTIQQDIYKCLCEENPNCYYKQLQREKQENQRYGQTLIAIEDIAKENIRIADLEGLNGVYRRGLAKQILQKISEVKNDRPEQK